tara:strand:+ start:1765 stop:2289 length:525 start_codon:yes stop_codon:yes gene_type:complete
MEFNEEKIIISKSGNDFSATIQSLGIEATGDSQNDSLQKLEKKYLEYFKFIKKNNIKGIRKIEQEENIKTEKKNFIKIFRNSLYKFISNIFFFIITLIIIFTFIKSEVLKISYEKFSRGGDLFDKIITELHKAADSNNDLDPALNKQITEDLRKVLQRSKPFIDEFKFLFSDEK